MTAMLEVLAPYSSYGLLVARAATGLGLAIHGYPKAKGGRGDEGALSAASRVTVE